MGYFDQDTIHKIHDQAVNNTPGLLNSWRQLLAGIPIGYTSQLQNVSSAQNPSFALLDQLSSMNEVSVLKGGVVPLERWLRNATYQADQYPDSSTLFREMADLIATKRAEKAEEAGVANVALAETDLHSPGELLGDVSEKVLFVNDMVPFGFLAKAERVSRSVARLRIPRFEGGKPRNAPFSNEQMGYFGTGWLIGKRHLITNHHVVNARDPGDADASAVDFDLQGRSAIVQFDYKQDNVDGDVRPVSKMLLANKKLDYTILELASDSNRDPLKLWGTELSLPKNSYVPVNVVQHPGGQPMKLGIRNNLAAALRENDFAYFTDTEGGSSGSPVCSDEWQVLALHKASTMSFGELEFQGMKTTWVNVGTRIDRIIADLANNHPGLWADIGADVIQQGA